MASKSDNTSFWVGYGDLMTSLFFVMMVLVVLLIAYVSYQRRQYQEEIRISQEQMRASKEQVRKLKELEEATKDLDEQYFSYDEEYKKFVLNISVQFALGSSDLSDIPDTEKLQLLDAGRALHRFMQEKHEALGVDFLLIIEGQASNDSYRYNRALSYERALALYNFWRSEGLDFENSAGFEHSEALVVGSGIYGKPRSTVERQNQRFLITLINKPGIIK